MECSLKICNKREHNKYNDRTITVSSKSKASSYSITNYLTNLTLIVLFLFRSLLQNPGSVFGRVLAEIHGHILELCFPLQLFHEDLFHFFLSVDYLWNEVQEALLLGK